MVNSALVALLLTVGMGDATLPLDWPKIAEATSLQTAMQKKTPPVRSEQSLLGPQEALRVFQQNFGLQAESLRGYSATTLIRADLPDLCQSGQFELKRNYVAPVTLTFTALHFTGDRFVRTNVINRMLQFDIDHLRESEKSATALNRVNYKMSYKETSTLSERTLYVYRVKPVKRRVGLFRGQIFLDAFTGDLVRAEGTIVKTPSFWVKGIQFVQEYANVEGFTLVTYSHSSAKVRLIGRALIDVYHYGYEVTRSLSAPTRAQSRSGNNCILDCSMPSGALAPAH